MPSSLKNCSVLLTCTRLDFLIYRWLCHAIHNPDFVSILRLPIQLSSISKNWNLLYALSPLLLGRLVRPFARRVVNFSVPYAACLKFVSRTQLLLSDNHERDVRATIIMTFNGHHTENTLILWQQSKGGCFADSRTHNITANFVQSSVLGGQACDGLAKRLAERQANGTYSFPLIFRCLPASRKLNDGIL